ncbi:ligand-gated channel [Vibrio sp. 10N.286.49.B3]|uniref:TonB-dependent hemoglobin/transferrin/lactoferrin family receptor n=1 Tax=Vibrio sp. 10N.286.49.B3 TaxID=1880855 RepID=UPI000C8253BB|nr:TonB-dependent hemoglobin/transferrin/lactoferrin family receptor [Vibrio sp. 10N.286.49.B3]PMH37107.1 ligand-gated channel [Vibrio sp. 10N.286.49.B3]
MFYRTHLSHSIYLALGLSTMAASVSAEESTAFTFDEVVVSATRSEQNLKDVASSIGTVTAEDLDNQMAGDLKQALASEPGVSMQGQGRFGLSNFNIRGRDENYVKIVVDGIQQSSSYNTGAGDDDVMRKGQGTIEVDTLQAVEINKGPVSSLYGSDALGGAIIMRTKNPSDLLGEGDDTHVSIKTGYASVDESFKTTATLANRTGRWETLLMYTYKDGHEVATHGDGADINGPDRGQADPFDIQSDNILAKVFYQANDDHRIGLTLEQFNRSGEGDILSKEGYSFMPGYTYTRNSAEDEDQRRRVSIEHLWQANNYAFDSLDWSLAYQTSYSNHDTYDHTDMNEYRNRQRNGEEESLQFHSQFDKAFELDASYHELNYGLSFSQDSFDLQYTNYFYDKGYEESAAPEVPQADSQKWGIFIQDQGFYLDDRLVMNFGLRYDNFTAKPDSSSGFEKSNNDAVTGRIGAVYHLSESLSTFAQVSQGFKAPTLDELYYSRDGGHGYEIVSNPNLKPEESVGYEIGTRYNHLFGRIEVAAYYNDYKNFIELDQVGMSDTGDVTYTNVNIAKAEIYGAELSSLISLDHLLNAPQGMYAEFNLAYAQGSDKKTGEAIDSIAPLTGYVAVGYHNPQRIYGGQISLQAVANKSGSDWSDEDNMTAPSYTVTDITAYYRPQQDLTLRAGLFNAFDEKYWLYSNLEGRNSGEDGLDRRTEPGRNWGVELEYIF